MELEMASSAMAVDADDEKLPWDPSKGIEHAARSFLGYSHFYLIKMDS